jgi:hypothetical protein
LEEIVVKATYDARTDTFSIVFKPDAEVAESGEDKSGVVLDYDRDGKPGLARNPGCFQTYRRDAPDRVRDG